MVEGALPIDKKNPPAPAAEPPKPTKSEPIKKGESKILEPTYDKKQTCDYDNCPITKKQILFGMHCVFYENKTYHALCAKSCSIEFKIQQPPRRAKEAST